MSPATRPSSSTLRRSSCKGQCRAPGHRDDSGINTREGVYISQFNCSSLATPKSFGRDHLVKFYPKNHTPQVKFGVPSGQIKFGRFCRFSALLAVHSALEEKAIAEYHDIHIAVFNLYDTYPPQTFARHPQTPSRHPHIWPAGNYWEKRQ